MQHLYQIRRNFLTRSFHFRWLRVCLVCIGFLFFYPSFAQQYIDYQSFVLDTKKKISQYICDRWTTDNGLPSNALRSIVQTQDGYLWISSYAGLIRFDGVRFHVFDKRNSDAMLVNSASVLHENKDYGLLIGTHGSGLLRYQNNKIENLSDKYDINVHSAIEAIFTASDGKIWLGFRKEGLAYIEKGKLHHVEDTLFNSGVTAITELADKTLIIGCSKGIIKMKDGKISVVSYKPSWLGGGVICFYLDKKQTLWIGTAYSLAKMDKNLHIEEISYFSDHTITNVVEDYAGSLWIASMRGLHRIIKDSGKIESYQEKDGLVHNDLFGMCLDKEGSLWVASYRAGLLRLKDGKFTFYSSQEGLATKSVSCVQEIGKNEYLIGTDAGTINWLKNGEISVFKTKNPIHIRIRDILKDSKGNIWIASYHGILKVEPNGKETVFSTKNKTIPDDQTRVLFEDDEGNIWAGFRSGGLVVLSPNGSIRRISTAEGLNSNFIMAIGQYEDKTMFIGTNNGGINVIDKKGDISHLSSKNQLNTDLIFSIRNDLKNPSVMWLTTNIGVMRYQKGKITNYSEENGLLVDSPFDIIEDANGNMWLPTTKGILKLSKKELNEVAEGTRKTISGQIFNKHDGMKQEECAGTSHPLRASDGTLWFPTLEGVAVLDPSKIPLNKLRPNVTIQSVVVDEELVLPKQEITIEAGKKRFVFNFTGLSLYAPDRVLFKYQLVGFDKDWSVSTKDRSVTYTNLPYGTYTFNVIGCNNDGFWNEKGASIKIIIEPHFYETKVFYLSIAVVFVLSVFGIYSWRTQRMKMRNEELEKLVHERTVEIQQRNEEITAQSSRIEEQKNELEKSYMQIQVVSDIGQKISSTLDFETLSNVLYENIKSLMGADSFGIGIVNMMDNRVEFNNSIHQGKIVPKHSIQIDDYNTISGYCLRTRKELLIGDIDTEYHNYFASPESIQQIGSFSALGMPLMMEKTAVGVIIVKSHQRHAYNESHINILRALASYVVIAMDNAKAYSIIRSKNQDITDSIRYALTIQQAVLPPVSLFEEGISDFFILYKPKDIVSGDFYWCSRLGTKMHVAVVDCTGHGVPGAFMSMVGVNLLNEIVNVELIHSPAQILQRMHQEIRIALRQEYDQNDDSMDIALCFIEPQEEDTVVVRFAGAKRPLFVISQHELIECKGSRKSLGGKNNRDAQFSEETLLLKKNDMLYLTSDGFADQASSDRTKFGSGQLKEILLQISHLPAKDQKSILLEKLEDHQGDAPQRDDITMIGIEL